ncbi:MAG TPA: glycosyltransferase, partial [Myxococcaceae bacterium]|nr:glycosyltransferase [Myxococcaceae bacterium]
MSQLGVGIACFPTVGGSGVAASQLAMQLAGRGHRVHVFSAGVPMRLAGDGAWTVHQADTSPRPPSGAVGRPVALARVMAEVAVRASLDILHVHYALPHGPAALLARELVREQGRRAPGLVTTLHGTDVTGLGHDAEMRGQVREAVLGSDAVLTPSAWLRRVAIEA